MPHLEDVFEGLSLDPDPVGYARYVTAPELEALGDLYRMLRLYVNFFEPR